MVEFFDYELTHFMQGTTKAIEQSVSKKEMLEFMMDTYQTRTDDILRVLDIQETNFKDLNINIDSSSSNGSDLINHSILNDSQEAQVDSKKKKA